MSDEAPQKPQAWYTRWKTVLGGASAGICACVAFLTQAGGVWKSVEPVLPKSVQVFVQDKLTPIDLDALNNVMYNSYVPKDQIDTLLGKNISEGKYTDNGHTTAGYLYSGVFGQLYIEYEGNKVTGWGYYSDKPLPTVISDLGTSNIKLSTSMSGLTSWWPEWPISITEDYTGKFSVVTYSNIPVGGKGVFQVNYLFRPSLKCNQVPNGKTKIMQSSEVKCDNFESIGNYFLIVRIAKEIDMDKDRVRESFTQAILSLNSIANHSLEHMKVMISKKMDNARSENK